MVDSVEYKTALKCFDRLVIALRQDPVTISNAFVSNLLIPPVDGHADAQRLAQLLLEKIKLVPSRYHDIVRIISGYEWLKDIVDIIQTEHSKLKN